MDTITPFFVYWFDADVEKPNDDNRTGFDLFALSGSGLATAAEKIRISVSSLDTVFLTPAAVHKRGFFKEEGIDPEIIRMNANVSITALTNDLNDLNCLNGWNHSRIYQ